MIGIEFSLKVSSAYSIRVPYSYQCARTYPLPAPSTIEGLCANALWRTEGGNPVDFLKRVHEGAVGATSRSEYPVVVSTCTVRVIPMNALLRQFAFTPHIDCMIVFKDSEEDLCERITRALRIAAVYLGDSESLVTVLPESISRDVAITPIVKDEIVEVNSLVNFKLIRSRPEPPHMAVLYMQKDPCDANAVLERYIAPLISEGDSYRPVERLSFALAQNAIRASGQVVNYIFPQEPDVGQYLRKAARKKRKT